MFCLYDPDARGRHHARREVVPPNRRRDAVSIQLTKTAYRTYSRQQDTKKIARTLRDSITVGFGALLVTFRAHEK